MNEENKLSRETGACDADGSDRKEQSSDRTAPVSGADKSSTPLRSAPGSSPLIQGGESLRDKLRKGPAAIIVASLCIFVIVLSGYIVFDALMGSRETGGEAGQVQQLDPSNALTLNLFFPLEGKVALEQRLVPKVTGVRDIAALAVREFLNGPSDEDPSYVPDAVELTGVYLGEDGILYLDFSSALTLNFKGDAVAEFLLLRSLYRTLNENTYGVKGYRLLVDGREVDTIGGHLYVLGGLEKAVPYRLMEEDEVE